MQDHARRTLVVGIGKAGALDEKGARALASPILRELMHHGVKQATLDATNIPPALAAQLADSIVNETYEFKKYKS